MKARAGSRRPLVAALLLAYAVPSLARAASRAELEAVLRRDGLSPARRAAIVSKLARLTGELPPRVPPPVPATLGCGTPCTGGTILLSHPFFEAVADCANGGLALRTGPSHPATIASGSRQPLTFDALADDTQGLYVSVRLHEDGTTYDGFAGASACGFDPPDTADEPNSVGLEQEWTLTPRPGLDLVLRQEVVAFGSTGADAGLRLTLTATSAGTSTESTTVGFRWWVDSMLGADDGPHVSTLTCPPVALVADLPTEHELQPAEISDVLRLGSETGPPVEAFVVTRALAGFPGLAVPDRLITARFSNAAAAPWDYAAVEGEPTGDDEVLIAWHGATPATGLAIAPGETATRSVVVLADCDRLSTCDPPIFRLSQDPLPACAGQPVALVAEIDRTGTGTFDWTWDYGDGSATEPVADPTVAVTHAYAAVGTPVATLTAVDTTDATCRSAATIVVRVEPGTPPAGSVGTLRAGRGGSNVLLSWADGTLAPPSYRLFRTTVPAESALTPAGIGDELVVAETSSLGAPDVGAVDGVRLYLYAVLPFDSCGDTVFP